MKNLASLNLKIQERLRGHGLILYDGECGFCQFWVQFIIKRDRKGYFVFAPLQAEWTKNFQATKAELPGFSSILFFDGNRVHQKSRAVFRIAGHLNGLWKCGKLLLITPSFISDYVYDFIAKRRHRLTTSCEIPTPEERLRFLDKEFS